MNERTNTIYFANEGIEMDMSYKKIQIKWVAINQIRLREPLEMQTIQHEKNLKWVAA